MTQTVTEGREEILGFREYVRQVADALGVNIENWCCSTAPPLEAVIQIDGVMPDHPDRDVALVWEEGIGWAVAIETRSGEDMIIVRELGGPPMPELEVVCEFAGLVEVRRRA